MGIPAPQGPSELLHVCLFVTAMILAYMITYTALEADSPSLVMTLKLKAAGKSGIPKEEFETFLSDDLIVLPRLKDLLVDKMAYKEGDIYRLTPKGRFMAKLFIFYRLLLGLEKGG
jgi:hypothetical protein